MSDGPDVVAESEHHSVWRMPEGLVTVPKLDQLPGSLARRVIFGEAAGHRGIKEMEIDLTLMARKQKTQHNLIAGFAVFTTSAGLLGSLLRTGWEALPAAGLAVAFGTAFAVFLVKLDVGKLMRASRRARVRKKVADFCD